MDNNRALSWLPKLWTRKSGRGAFHGRRRSAAMPSGAHGNAYVGMSNDNAGEKPARRKAKVSYAMLISVGLVGP